MQICASCAVARLTRYELLTIVVRLEVKQAISLPTRLPCWLNSLERVGSGADAKLSGETIRTRLGQCQYFHNWIICTAIRTASVYKLSLESISNSRPSN